MRQSLLVFIFSLLVISTMKAQENKTAANEFKMFSRPEISYLFGLNPAYNNEKINSLHIKLVIGTTMPRLGFGVGVENTTFRSATGSGLNFQTLNFSLNTHVLAKPITTNELNFFLKVGIGYAPRIFRTNNKGFNYEFAPGILLSTKKRSRYFLQAIYQYQEIAGFSTPNGHPKVKALGLGVGTWF